MSRSLQVNQSRTWKNPQRVRRLKGQTRRGGFRWLYLFFCWVVFATSTALWCNPADSGTLNFLAALVLSARSVCAFCVNSFFTTHTWCQKNRHDDKRKGKKKEYFFLLFRSEQQMIFCAFVCEHRGRSGETAENKPDNLVSWCRLASFRQSGTERLLKNLTHQDFFVLFFSCPISMRNSYLKSTMAVSQHSWSLPSSKTCKHPPPTDGSGERKVKPSHFETNAESLSVCAYNNIPFIPEALSRPEGPAAPVHTLHTHWQTCTHSRLCNKLASWCGAK